MTFERASEIVKALKETQIPLDTKAVDLLEHFINGFGLRSPDQIETFARMSGYEKISFNRIKTP